MRRADLAERIDTGEHRMDSMEQRLDASFNALSTQILQSRRETNDAILGLRSEFSTMRTNVSGEFSAMRGRFESLETAMVDSWTHFENSIAASQGDTRRYMKVLYEELRSQIKLLNEGHPSSS